MRAMIKIIKGIVLVTIALFLTTACDTDNQSMLSDGIWNFKNMTTDSESEDIVTLIALGKAILTEGTMEFNTDKTYILTAPLLQDPETGTWSLIGEDQLILDSDGDLGSTANIETLSKKELVYIETFADAEMNPYSVTTSWTRN